MTKTDAIALLKKHGQHPNLSKAAEENFMTACKKGRTEIVEAYLTIGMSTELHNDISLETPLIRAAEGNHPNVARILTQFGADLEGRDHPQDTALHTAVNWGNIEVLKTLYDLGAKVDTHSRWGESPIWSAIDKGKTEIFDYLLTIANPNAFGEDNNAVTQWCIIRDRADVLPTIFEKSTHKPSINLTNKDGNSLVMVALLWGKIHIANELLAFQPDLTIKNKYGWNAMEYAHILNDSYLNTAYFSDLPSPLPAHVRFFKAITNQDKETIERLIAEGFSLQTLDALGFNAVMSGIKQGVTEDFLSFLIAKGVDLQYVTENGETCIDVAINNDKKTYINLLLKHNAKVNNTEGVCKALYMVINKGDLALLKKLVKAGANLQNLHHTYYAFKYGEQPKNNKKIMEFLHKEGANLEIRNLEYGETLFTEYGYDVNIEMIQTMLDAGIDPNRVDGNNMTALNRLANKYGNNDANTTALVNLLLDKGTNLGISGKYGGDAYYNALHYNGDNVKLALEDYYQNQLTSALAAAGFRNVAAADAAFWQSYAKTQDYATLIVWMHQNQDTVVQNLIRGGVQVNPNEIVMDSPLKEAISAYNATWVKLLLEAGADPNYEMKYGTIALSAAMYDIEEYDAEVLEKKKSAQLEIIQLLLDAGANPNHINYYHTTPLGTASQNITFLNLLYSKGADVRAVETGWSPFISAARSKKIEVVEWFLSKGADINQRNADAKNALMILIENDDNDIAQYLMDEGIDIEAQDFEGETPLIKATKKGNITMINALIQAGANPNIADNTGMSALSYSELRPELQPLFAGFSRGKSDNEPQNQSIVKDKPLTELLLAIYHRDVETAIQLIENGQQINETNYRGDTPLMIAINTYQPEIAEKLIAAGADVFIKNDVGRDAFTWCLVKGNETIKKKLEEKGRKMILGLEDLNMQASEMMAQDDMMNEIKNGNLIKIKQLLKEKTVDINLSHNGTSWLAYAIGRDDLALVNLLLSMGAMANITDGFGNPVKNTTSNKEIFMLLEKYERK